jgi:hypothetical protein
MGAMSVWGGVHLLLQLFKIAILIVVGIFKSFILYCIYTVAVREYLD